MNPPGYMTVSEALDALGREIFGALWTGDERRARGGLVSIEAYEWARTVPAGTPWPRHLADGQGKTGQGWPFGNVHAAEYQDERQASARWAAVKAKLHEQLAIGARKAIVVHHDALVLKISLRPSDWLEKEAAENLQHGWWPVRGRNKGNLYIAKPVAVVSTAAWVPDKAITLKAWCTTESATVEARRRSRAAISANPSEKDLCKALARMWEDSGRGPAKYQTIEQYRIANRSGQIR